MKRNIVGIKHILKLSCSLFLEFDFLFIQY